VGAQYGGGVQGTLDRRTRPADDPGPSDPASFWATTWATALERHGARATADAAHLGLGPLTLLVAGEAWGISPVTLAVSRGGQAPVTVELEADAFADLVTGRRSGLGLAVAGRARGDGVGALCAWDPVLRSVLDGRPVYRPGDIVLRAADGGPLDLDRRFRLDDPAEHADAAHFLAAAGFLSVAAPFTTAEIDALDAELTDAVVAARPDDGTSWWASTADGDRYPTRILDLADRSPTLQTLVADRRYLAVGQLLGLGHRPGDPFGERFAGVTAEGLTKRVGSVDGLVCLPWHNDCERGGHSMFCCGITVGICLTPVDPAHGGLDVYAGSHRANIARAQFDRGLDLPAVSLAAERGDLTVHLSCTLHRSTHPTRSERRVVYTGFALPVPDDDDGAADTDRTAALRRDRSAIGAANPSGPGR
jgi:hypothetical protein